MIKRLALALALAATFTAATAPAEAGIFKNAAKKVVIGVVGVAAIGASCAVQIVSGRQQFLCPRR